jgi:hypothetical protein
VVTEGNEGTPDGSLAERLQGIACRLVPSIAEVGDSLQSSCVLWAVHATNYSRPTDAIDQRLVEAVLRDGRAPYATLAQAVGLSVSAIKRRVDRLPADDVIKGFTAIVDPPVLGWHLPALEAFTVSSAADAALRIAVRDVVHLERVISRLRALPYVQQTDTTMLLSSLVQRPLLTG